MQYSFNDEIKNYKTQKKSRKIFRNFVRIMGCIVAFVTTYALILPAITMEKDSFCGFEEHAHTEACYVLEIQNRVLACNGEKLELHVHNDECRGDDGTLLCGLADYVAHSHDDSCRNEDGVLLCALEERTQHIHDDGCYDIPEPVLHIHSEACEVPVKGDLLCTEEEVPGHKHSKLCYQPGPDLECTQIAGHQHSDDCYISPLVCALSTLPHFHDDTCYGTGALICSIPVDHRHTDICVSSELFCASEEPDHSHGPECYVTKTVCNVPEGHQHTGGCYESIIICGMAEGEVHTHESACYSAEVQLACSLAENHVHADSCYYQELICGLQEYEGHLHEDTCYQWNLEYNCGMEEGEPEPVTPVLVCTEPVAATHVHGESCFETEIVAANPICEEQHDHTIDCYEMSCMLEEHTHKLQCYSDPSADIESRKTWEATLKDVEFSGNWHLDVIAVAESQIGYTESKRNYEVRDDNSLAGYTRYGAWYGIPYGDWCAMFTSFCLHYSGVEGMPLHCGVVPWIELLTEQELYRVADEYIPIGGDLVFFDWDDDSLADHVGIVYEIIEATETEKAKLKTIEGNSSNRVQFVIYDLDDPTILGFGMLPEKPLDEEITRYCGFEGHVHTQACYSEAGELLCGLEEHVHVEACFAAPPAEQRYYCGLEVHIHEDICYGEAGELICGAEAHVHAEACMTQSPTEFGYFCGFSTHTHSDNCLDDSDSLICGITAHSHTSVCLTDLTDLDDYARKQVVEVIGLIDEIPSADEIDAKIMEFEDAEAYEEEELWLTEIYQNVGLAYARYVGLTEDLQDRVINRDKLMELEYIWSMMPLATYYVWLDGTNGKMMSLAGSDNTRYTLQSAGQNPYAFTLPTSWKSPTKYQYTLRGWYDIYSRRYYSPGATVTIDRNTVFYADWEAASYNIGQFNAHVVDTLSTNDFVTTRLFDYSGIMNMLSSSMNSGSVSQNSHNEKWNAVTKGNNLSDGSKSLGIILRDWDSAGDGPSSRPTNWSDSSQKHNTSQDTVTFGLYDTYNMYDLFFNPYSDYLGKEYLGTADHLFQRETDPNSPYYGYYYYDSARNAASYNQSAGRFYVYDYLERTTTSQDNNKDSDFLPFNSHYTNNPQNYNPVQSTSSSGQTIYTYDSGDGNNRTTGTNFWFGMSLDIRFYLPNTPGLRDESGVYVNQSLNGRQMEFSFSGDDDVFVLVDGELVLDIGGMHDIKSGTINFSTGIVTVEGSEQTSKTAIVKNMKPGEHTLTLLYMERGSSMSNCSIYFNIVPRFTFSLQKEDLLTNELLNGAEFQVFMDEACSVPAKLWQDYNEHVQNPDNTTNTLVVNKGKATIWGIAAGNTYYIKETKPPDTGNYALPNGLIKMELSNKGVASYTALVIPDPNAPEGEATSLGFTVEGFQVDAENHIAYLVVNNSALVGETKELLVRKVWVGDRTTPVTVYLLADGQRIREQVLSTDNDWEILWDNLPVYQEDGKTPIVYTVEEGTVPGFVGTIESVTAGETVMVEAWVNASNFTKGQNYLLSTSGGNLAADNGKLFWTDDTESPAALWNVDSVSGDTVTLRNDLGYYLREKANWSNNDYYFYTDRNSGTVSFTDSMFWFTRWYKPYYMTASINSSGRASASDDGGVIFTLKHKSVTESTADKDGFVITNTPIPETEQVSLKVTKIWTDRDGETLFADSSAYEQLQVPVKLLANNLDTGQVVRLNLRNSWTYTFQGLPAKDDNGPIAYSVIEDWESEDWSPHYKVSQVGTNSYTAEINNVYSRTITIPVEKLWDGSIKADMQDDVLIQLYTAAGENQNGTLAAEITLSAKSGWMGVFDVIPPEEVAGNYYVYEPTEVFGVEYSQKAKIYIDGRLQNVGLITFDPETGQPQLQTVTNHAKERLPETGSTGTLPYTTGGLLLITAAMILLYIHISKRRREDDSSS